MKRAILYLFILSGCNLFAQPKSDFKTLADKAFQNKEYYEAAFYYEKAALAFGIAGDKEVPFQKSVNRQKNTRPNDRAYLIYHLAQSHRLYENYVKALPWYQKMLTEEYEAAYPDSRLWYGVCLRATANFEEAIKQLNQYLTVHRTKDDKATLAMKEISDCRFAIEQYKYPVLANTSKLKDPYNVDGSNYSLFEQGGTQWFTSSRMDKSSKKRINRTYSLTGGNLTVIGLPVADQKVDDEIEYGTPSITKDGNRMYLTRWFKKNDLMRREIIMLARQGENWGNPIKLNLNVNPQSHNSMQPYVTPDGRHLYYSSDKQGGHGGYDIWVSMLNHEGQAVNAVNLGTKVNTSRDEQAPHYDNSTKRLIFGSKGHIGLGGFDLFESFEVSGSWSAPGNLGVPFNSPKDDLYYYPSDTQKGKFYLSSDRDSECCLEIFEGIDQKYFIKGLVRDCESGEIITGLKVSLQDSLSGSLISQFTTDRNGAYKLLVRSKKPYRLVFEKSGYFSKVISLPKSGNTSTDTMMIDEVCLRSFKVGKPMALNNILYDFNTTTLRPESKVILDSLVTLMRDNPDIKIELAAHTDGVGSDAFNLKLSQQRAQGCADYMISNGIHSDRIFARGYGERRPVALNTFKNGKDNPEGRQKNRRTEFTVLQTK